IETDADLAVAATTTRGKTRRLASGDLSDVFGIDLDDGGSDGPPQTASAKQAKRKTKPVKRTAKKGRAGKAAKKEAKKTAAKKSAKKPAKKKVVKKSTAAEKATGRTAKKKTVKKTGPKAAKKKLPR
ncbi:MAG: hypothetical protein ABIK89_21460, partial [Planctomycetota bacterium]